jgi:hypothetical protein
MFKDLEDHTKDLVKFGFFLQCLINVIETHYLELVQRFPNSSTKKNTFVFSYDDAGYFLAYYKPTGKLGYMVKLYRTTAKSNFHTKDKNYRNEATMLVNVNSKMKERKFTLQFAEGDGNGGWRQEELTPITSLHWLGELYNDLVWLGRNYDSEKQFLELLEKSYFPLASQLGLSRADYNKQLQLFVDNLQ